MNDIFKNANQRLRERCYKGLKKRFGENVEWAVEERLENELDIVAQNEDSVHYLLASMLSEEAMRLEETISFRGTITSSLIAYTSGISEINPMGKEYGGMNLRFEMTREEFEGIAPSLEIDCSSSFTDEAYEYIAKIILDSKITKREIVNENGLDAVRLWIEEKADSLDSNAGIKRRKIEVMFIKSEMMHDKQQKK